MHPVYSARAALLRLTCISCTVPGILCWDWRVSSVQCRAYCAETDEHPLYSARHTVVRLTCILYTVHGILWWDWRASSVQCPAYCAAWDWRESSVQCTANCAAWDWRASSVQCTAYCAARNWRACMHINSAFTLHYLGRTELTTEASNERNQQRSWEA